MPKSIKYKKNAAQDIVDILLINPSLDFKIDKEKRLARRVEGNIPNQESPHIGIAYLIAAAKQKGISFKYFDMLSDEKTIEDIISYIGITKPHLIGFTAFTVQINAAGKLAEKIKETYPDACICVGGPHVSAAPKETLNEFTSFDFIVCGEAESILPDLVEASKDKTKLKKIPGVVTRNHKGIPPIFIKDIDNLPFPAWEEFDLSKYPGANPHQVKQELPMVTSRGCHHRCTFCCRALGDVRRQRSVYSVIAEIEYNIENYGCEAIAFFDETLLSNAKWNDEFFETLIKKGINRKIKWSCSTRVSRTSRELFQRMKQAGCYFVFFGIESSDHEILKRINKGITTDQIRNAVKWAKEAGIVPVGAFIIGLPGAKEEHVFKDIELAKELNLYSVTFPIAVPFPGTELREVALRNEYGMRVVSNNWDHYGKQDPEALESDDISVARRKELQQIAYSVHPKKKFNNYLETLNEQFS